MATGHATTHGDQQQTGAHTDPIVTRSATPPRGSMASPRGPTHIRVEADEPPSLRRSPEPQVMRNLFWQRKEAPSFWELTPIFEEEPLPHLAGEMPISTSATPGHWRLVRKMGMTPGSAQRGWAHVHNIRGVSQDPRSPQQRGRLRRSTETAVQWPLCSPGGGPGGLMGRWGKVTYCSARHK